jgi:SagB-type dehydrogenase family enzyme
LGIGERFQKETKYDRNTMKGGFLNWATKPDIYKTYSGVKKIKLPEPKQEKNIALDEILQIRHSVRNFSEEPVSIQDLSYLLWATTGIQRIEHGYEFRTAPSAGALYPIETYLVVNNVEDLEQGVYHYAIKNHKLEQLKVGDYSIKVAKAALGQKIAQFAAVDFIWTAIYFRSMWKYKQRGFRYIYLDCGHIGQNLALASVSLGLGSCQIGAIFDGEANEIVGVDGEKESVIYMSVVGHPKQPFLL